MEPQPEPPRPSVLPWVVLAAGLLLSSVVTVRLWRLAQEQDQQRFHYRVERTLADVEDRLDLFLTVLHGAAGLFVASDGVTPEEFERFFDGLKSRRSLAGMREVAFVRCTRSSEREALIEEMARQGIEGFRIRPDGLRPEYCPVVFVEPPNPERLGFDLLAEPVCREAMLQAHDTGRVVVSDRLVFSDDLDPADGVGFFIFVPVPRSRGVPADAEGNRGLWGFVAGRFRFEDLHESVFAASLRPGLNLVIRDEDAVLEQIGDAAARRRGAERGPRRPSYQTTAVLNMAGRPWTLEFSTNEAFDHESDAWQAPVVLATGVLMTLLLFHAVRSLALARSQAEQSAVELLRSQEALRTLNETLEDRVLRRTAEAEQRAAQLRRLVLDLSQAEQRERRRLSQVLHDHLQQLLVAVRFQVHTLKGRFAETEQPPEIEQAEEALGQAIQECRTLTGELGPSVLYDGNLAAALDWLARHMHRQYGLTVEVTADPEADPSPLSTRILLFQAVRELLFNVVKHAGVDRARVTLEREGDRIRLTVEDGGRGFDPARIAAARHAGSFGLFSIRERLELLGGDLSIESAPGAGARFTLVVPADSASSSE